MCIYLYVVGKGYLSVKKSEYLGNNPDNIGKLKKTEGKIPFSFAFISDTENSDASGWLIKTLLREKIDFLVLVGDSVNDSTWLEHRLFMNRISNLKPRLPIFVIPSNHDINITDKSSPLQFNKKDFQEIYGPINFHFVYNNCLFIFFSNISQEDKISRDYLEKVLSSRSNIKYTFVFCPTPLRKILNRVFSVPYWVSEFDKLLNKYKVDYVISGDYHRHFEILDDNGIQYITSGSGGSHFYGEDKFGRFFNGTKVTVHPDGVSREILVCSKIRFTDNSIRRFIYNKIMPSLENCLWLLSLIMSIFVINFLYSLSFIFNVRRDA